MRFLLFAIILFFSANMFGQITILTENRGKVNKQSYVYDSLQNVCAQKDGDSYTYRHLIGQTLLYCGNPDRHFYPKRNYIVGDYYIVTNILPDDPDRGLYRRFSMRNTRNGSIVEEGDLSSQSYNSSWVVRGHYEKIKSMYVGKEFVYVGNNYNDYYKENNFINLDTDEPVKSIPLNSTWTCLDVQVKPRNKSFSSHNDDRSPIVLILDNSSLGKHYCYLEGQRGPYSIDFKNRNPLICGKLKNKTLYNEQKNQLIKKFGRVYANMILEGKVKIGMTKAMCKESWGEPIDINKTIGNYGSIEQWIYGDGCYLYFKGNRLTDIQN